MSAPASVYRSRNPQPSLDYQEGCVEGYFEIFVGHYDEHFSRQEGNAATSPREMAELSQ